MVDTKQVHTNINNALTNIEKLQQCLLQIEQEFTDTNYPNWKFLVTTNGSFYTNPECCVIGRTIEKGLNTPAILEVRFRCCDKCPTIRISWIKLRFNSNDAEYQSILREIIKIKVIPFDLLRKLSDVLYKVHNINELELIKKELKIELKKISLNKDFENG